MIKTWTYIFTYPFYLFYNYTYVCILHVVVIAYSVTTFNYKCHTLTILAHATTECKERQLGEGE